MTGEVIDLRQPMSEAMSFGKALSPPRFERRVDPRVFGATPDFVTTTDYCLNTHQGTHVDAPHHVYENGNVIGTFPLEKFLGAGVVLDVSRSSSTEISATELAAAGTVSPGDIVFLFTGWFQHFGSEEYFDYPYLADDATRWLIEKRVKMVGTDTLSPDLPSARRPPRYHMPAHRELLGRDVLIVENIGDMRPVLGRRVEISAAPINLADCDGAPCALYARLL